VRGGVRTAADALAGAGYRPEEIEPPRILDAAKTLLDMLNTAEVRANFDASASALPADTQQFLAMFYDVAGKDDPAATVASFSTRHQLLRAWGEFQETHPLIIAPVLTDLPFKAGADLEEGVSRQRSVACAWPWPSTRSGCLPSQSPSASPTACPR
jgi:amidase